MMVLVEPDLPTIYTCQSFGPDTFSLCHGMRTQSFPVPMMSLLTTNADTTTDSGLTYSALCYDIFSFQGDLKKHSNSLSILDSISNPLLEDSPRQVCQLKTLTNADIWEIRTNHANHEVCYNKQNIDEALAFLQGAPEVLSIEDLIAILQSYKSELHAGHVRQLHLHLCSFGLDSHKDVGNFLVPTFVQCGCLDVVEQLFSRLFHQNEHSWTFLIQSYVARGMSEQALDLYDIMIDDLIEPSDHTYVFLLKACILVKGEEKGKFFHSEIVKRGIEHHVFVESALVDMYAKCGSLLEAHQTFDKMAVRDIVPWTSLISGYVEFGFGEEALECMQGMRLDGLSPDAVTVASIMKACGLIGPIEKGRTTHSELVKLGFDGDVIAGNVVLDMYANFGSLLEARKIFEALPVRDIVSWTTMLAAYVEDKLFQEAFACLSAMQLEGVDPVASTYVCILKACLSMNEIYKGRYLHSEVLKKGFEGEVMVGNTLVDMYGKFGLLAEAWDILMKLPNKDAVPWTALIGGYLEQEDAEQVLECLEQVQNEGVPLDEALFACSLKACGILVDLDKGQEVHGDIVKVGFEGSTYVDNSLVGMYAKCGALCEASKIFGKLQFQDVISWNVLLTSYSEYGLFEDALTCFNQMQFEGVVLDSVTWASILKACGRRGAIDMGYQIHAELIKKGRVMDLLLSNTLVDMYSKCGSPLEAQKMFDRLTSWDLVSWNALLLAYTTQKLDEEALCCFQQMQLHGECPDVVSWNMMILLYVEQGQNERGRMFYSRMLEQGLLPNNIIFVSLLKACGDQACIESVRQIHVQVCHNAGVEPVDPIVATTLIDIYGKCGSMHDAQQVFNTVAERVIPTWNALITSYARQGQTELVFGLLSEMVKDGMELSDVAFLGALTVCNHAGLLKEGEYYFKMMCDLYDLVPDLEHHTCVVNLLGVSGHLDEAARVVEELPVQPDVRILCVVMGACLRLGGATSGHGAFKHAVVLNSRHAGLYVSMANLYLDGGMWEDSG